MERRLIVLIVVILLVGTAGLFIDVDSDGLDTAAELYKGTDVFDADTDGDGIIDGDETDTDPLDSDTDGDGLSDGEEMNQYGTDPTMPDTDKDGLRDGKEVQVGTDPTSPDTDGDGLDDSAELAEGSDPLRKDSDSDGLVDGVEVNRYGTDPTDPDTDGDSLSDKMEATSLDTSPTEYDTDSDFLADDKEVQVGTDPTSPDTDGDGFSDGIEVHVSPDEFTYHPLKKDVIVQFEYMESIQSPRDEVQAVVEKFESAPVNNPNGSRGINLQVFSTGSISYDDSTNKSDVLSVKESNIKSGFGVHYGFSVNEVDTDIEGGDRAVGLFYQGNNTFVVRADRRSNGFGSTFMHEIGHSLGLNSEVFSGVDSKDYSSEEYPSVMNYNTRTTCSFARCSFIYEFSDGAGHDDWGYIAQSMPENTPDTSRAEELAKEAFEQRKTN